MFQECQLKRTDIDTLKRWVRYRLGGYVININNLHTNNLLYRGVKWSDRPKLIKDISYPEPHFVTDFGRANRPGQPMFYCSRAAPAVFYEMRIKAGDFIALSEWSVSESLWMHHLGYHPEALRRIGAPEETMRQRLTHPLPNEPAKNAKLRRQLSLAFTADVREQTKYKYKLSIAINELLFDGASPLATYDDDIGPISDQAAGTVYPSMQLRGCADNLVLLPKFVDSALRLRSIRYIRVDAADETTLSFTLQTIGIAHQFYIPDGQIIWSESLPPDIECRSTIALENGVLILRDGRGQIYDAHVMQS